MCAAVKNIGFLCPVFYGIITDMRYRLSILCLSAIMCCAGAANANWERRPVYVDNGVRFTVSARGGFAYGAGKIKNDLGTLVPEPYYFDPVTGEVLTETYCLTVLGGCGGLDYLGQIDIAELPAKKNLSSFTWAGGVAIGATLPYKPQWRVEADWLHISEYKYSAWPMFSGSLTSNIGVILDGVSSGGVHSTVTNDVVSAMVYYDFFDGCEKPKDTVVPYIGFGIGYASSRTVLELTDLYGDLSGQAALQQFGEPGVVTLDFYTSKTTSGNVSGSVTAGLSYRLFDAMFLDLGLRVTYIPKIQWALNNELATTRPAGDKSKDIFSANNVLYTSALLGVRFEF